MTQKGASPPPHIEDTLQTTSEMHARHYREATADQRFIDRLTQLLGTPAIVGIITAVVVLWVGLNLLLPHFGAVPLDRPPFPWLQGAISGAALYITVLILITQRRENVLSEERAQLILQLAIVNEQKAAKLIELAERSSRDNPLIEHRDDPEAAAMSQPADPRAMIDAIKEAHEEMRLGDNPSPSPSPPP